MGKRTNTAESGQEWAAFLGWYDRQKRVLPWRDEPSLYRVWISEIMLQQTQVATVVPYFEKFMGRFPTVRDLAEASEEEVMRHWAGLGYYSRARNLQKGARVIHAQGRFPRTREEWLEIPGVGAYTAGAICSIALNHAEPILDGNVERVLSRVHRVADPGPGKKRLWDLAATGVREAHDQGHPPRDFNQALMELGATVCTPKSPSCLLCPLAPRCEARAAGDWAEFPAKRKAKTWEKVSETVYCIADREGRVLLRRRRKGEWRAGLWDLPDEMPAALADRLAPHEPPAGPAVVRSRYVVTHHKIERTTRVLRLAGARAWKAAEAEAEDYVWANLERPLPVAIGAPLRKTLPEILEKLTSSRAL